jgi:hypothetical protein
MDGKVRNGVMPWTLIIADFLEKGTEWDKLEVAQCLRQAQAKIDELTTQLEKQNG